MTENTCRKRFKQVFWWMTINWNISGEIWCAQIIFFKNKRYSDYKIYDLERKTKYYWK
jgi:hypothetical protein